MIPATEGWPGSQGVSVSRFQRNQLRARRVGGHLEAPDDKFVSSHHYRRVTSALTFHKNRIASFETDNCVVTIDVKSPAHATGPRRPRCG